MSSNGGESVGKAASDLENRVEGRFGVLPNFFRLAPETPEIIEKLWGFAQAAYLDNPLPSVFKERLFVHLVPLLRGPLLHRSSCWFLGGIWSSGWRSDCAYAKFCRGC